MAASTMLNRLVRYLDYLKLEYLPNNYFEIIMSADPRRRGEVRYHMSVHDSDKYCILGQKFTSTLLSGVPMPRYMRMSRNSVIRFPQVLGSRYSVQVISETFTMETVRNSDGIILLFDLLSPESFKQMTVKLWKIIDIKKHQKHPDKELTVTPMIFIVGYQGPAAWARRLTDAHIEGLVASSNATYFEIERWDQIETASITWRLAHDISEELERQRELVRTSVPYASLTQA